MSEQQGKPASGAVRLAYADPPYLGKCGRHYGHEHNDGGSLPFDGLCWDELDTHRLLLEYVRDEFDGWAYSCLSTNLADVLPLVSGVRIGTWVKSFAAFKRNVRVAYAWEPVLWVPGRDNSKNGAPVGRDFIVEPIAMRKGFTGAKPERVCRWIADNLGYVDGDDLADLFPGTNSMARALAQLVTA